MVVVIKHVQKGLVADWAPAFEMSTEVFDELVRQSIERGITVDGVLQLMLLALQEKSGSTW